MAKYSKAYYRIMGDWNYPKPHIFREDDCWTCVFGKGCVSEDVKADRFCQKLNNAAQKRCLKA